MSQSILGDLSIFERADVDRGIHALVSHGEQLEGKRVLDLLDECAHLLAQRGLAASHHHEAVAATIYDVLYNDVRAEASA